MPHSFLYKTNNKHNLNLVIFQSTPMESVGSNSPPPYDPTQHITDRIIRALSHRLALLHRSDPRFYILGATGNVYTVTVSHSPACTCPDRVAPCKHILFVLLRVLGLPFGEPSLYRRTLPPCQLTRVLSSPTAPGVMAGARAVERFHQVFSGNAVEGAERRGRGEGGGVCPVCLEEMVEGGGEGEEGVVVVTCSTCGNSLHGECFGRWKRSRGRRAASCVVCRARWREKREVESYVNLAAYVSVGEEEEEERGWGSCAR